jgi:hypothetical protein
MPRTCIRTSGRTHIRIVLVADASPYAYQAEGAKTRRYVFVPVRRRGPESLRRGCSPTSSQASAPCRGHAARLARVEPAREFAPVVTGPLGPACRRVHRVPRTSPLLRGQRSSRPLARFEPVGAGGAWASTGGIGDSRKSCPDPRFCATAWRRRRARAGATREGSARAGGLSQVLAHPHGSSPVAEGAQTSALLSRSCPFGPRRTRSHMRHTQGLCVVVQYRA